MRNLIRAISAVLASALRNPDCSQPHDFQIALKFVTALVDFSLMAQYRSHTPDTLSYLERYQLTFHQTKGIFLEFRTWKATCAEANCQDGELRELIANERADEIRRTSEAKWRRQAVTTLQIGSYSGLDSSPYGIPSGNRIEDRPVYLVYYR